MNIYNKKNILILKYKFKICLFISVIKRNVCIRDFIFIGCTKNPFLRNSFENKMLYSYNQGLKYLIYWISVKVETISIIDNRLSEKLKKQFVISAIYNRYIGFGLIYHGNIGCVAHPCVSLIFFKISKIYLDISKIYWDISAIYWRYTGIYKKYIKTVRF